MGRQEQIEERQVLDSIYPDEIIDVSEEEFHIAIALDTDDDTGSPPVVTLSVRLPEAYPVVAPHVVVLVAEEAAAAHSDFHPAEDRTVLLQTVAAAIRENTGEPMVYSLVMAVKEAAEGLMAERRAAVDRVRRERDAAEASRLEKLAVEAENEENRKFHGTRVTADTFMQWLEKRRREAEEAMKREEDELAAAEARKGRIREPPKLTGKQLWERGLVGWGREDDDDELGLVEGTGKLQVGP